MNILDVCTKVGYERLEETVDPEITIRRALRTYLQELGRAGPQENIKT